MHNGLVVLVGPTAAGKSKIGIEVASQINAEIVSGDSMQVYQHMNIGTAKISEPEKWAANGRYVKHHLIDCIPPTQDYSVANFQEAARKCIHEVQENGRIPILLGGTGLYVRSVIDTYDFDVHVDHDLRKALLERVKVEGTAVLYKQLIAVDPSSGNKIHENDVKRIVRAIEYYETTGKKISENQQIDLAYPHFHPLAMIGITMPREELYARINKRVDDMIERGLVDEVSQLLYNGVLPSNTSMQAIGYRQIVDHLEGKISFERAIELIKRDTRRFAKRQLTWFLRDQRIVWFDAAMMNESDIICEIKKEISRKLALPCGNGLGC